MAYNPPRKNVQYIFYIGLVSQSTGQLQANPTIAAGDFKVSIDGGAFGNLGTLPAVTPASGKAVKVTLSNTEMNGDNVVVLGADAAGAEWNDIIVSIQPSIAYSTDGVIDSNMTRIDGQATNGYNATLKLKKLEIQNNSSHAIEATSTNPGSSGIFAQGNGSGSAMTLMGGATGDGLYSSGGNTGIRAIGGSADGIAALGGSSSGNGLFVMAQAAGYEGASFQANGANADGISIYSTANALNLDHGGSGKSINAPNDIAVSDGDLTVANVKLISAGQLTVKKNVALPNFSFVMTDVDGVPLTGLSPAAARRIDSGAFAACANTPATELANGWYTIDLADSDLNGTVIALRFSDTGAADTNFTIITQD